MVVPRVPLDAAALPASTGIVALSSIRMVAPLLRGNIKNTSGRARYKSQRRFVDAVAQIGGLGPVIKDVAQVRVATCAMRFGSFDQHREIGPCLDVFLR